MIPILGDILKPLLDKALSFIPDPTKKAEAQMALQKELDDHSEKILASLTAVDLAQAQTNTEEAKSSDKFVSRARPAIMWICAFGLGFECVMKPIIGSLCVIAKHAEMVPLLPVINGEVLMTMLGWMLGYGGARTWEKIQNVHNEH